MITGTIATVQPYGLKLAPPIPAIAGLLRVSDGSFLVWHSSEVTLVPGGPRLRVGTPCTAEPDGPYARSVVLTEPVPFP